MQETMKFGFEKPENEAQEILNAVYQALKEKGYSCTLVNARFVKPIDEEIIKELSKEHKLLVTMEENVASGGYGEKVRAFVDEQELDTEILTVAIPDEYVEHGNVDILKKEVGIDAETVVNNARAKQNKKN